MSWLITGSEKTSVDRLGIQNVSLLLHGDGINGSNIITDSSPSSKTVTAGGNAQISSANSKFGSSSILLDGSNDYLQINGSDFNVTLNNNITFECFFYSLVSGLQCIFSTAAVTVYLRTDGQVQTYNPSGNYISGSGAIINAWHHLAVCVSNNVMHTYLNGIKSTSSYTYSSSAGNSILYIGDDRTTYPQDFNGYIDEFRVTKLARYTSNFTPPTAPFPDI